LRFRAVGRLGSAAVDFASNVLIGCAAGIIAHLSATRSLGCLAILLIDASCLVDRPWLIHLTLRDGGGLWSLGDLARRLDWRSLGSRRGNTCRATATRTPRTCGRAASVSAATTVPASTITATAAAAAATALATGKCTLIKP
jgi:hypothetical protein